MSSSGSGQEIGKVINVKGNAWAEGPEGTRVLEKGDMVYEGESIITESGSNVEVKFLDDTILSQGSDSVLRLDEYVFDLENMDDSGLSFNLMQGTFRHVTGRIAEQNPERVNLESPLSLIGIRGTVTVHVVGPDSESHGVEDISEGFQVILTDSFGEVRVITLPMTMLDVFAHQPMGLARPMTPHELQFFREIAPGALEGLEFDEDVVDDEDIDEDPDVEPDDEDALDEDDDDDVDDEDEPDGEGAADPDEVDSDPDDPESGDEPLPQVEVDEDEDDASQQDDAPQARLYTPPPAPPVSPAPPPVESPDDDDDDVTLGQDDDDDEDPADSQLPIDHPSWWETRTSGGHPDYSWLPDKSIYSDPILGDDGHDADEDSLIIDEEPPGARAVFGFDGNDTIIVEGHSNNLIYAGAGNDEVIITGNGNNTIYGGSGNDLIDIEGDGHNVIYPGPGENDVHLYNSSGNNYVYSESGHDEVLTGPGQNTIEGAFSYINVNGAGWANNDSIDGYGNDNNTIDFYAGNYSQNFFISDDHLRNINIVHLFDGATGVDLGDQSNGFLVDVIHEGPQDVTIVGSSGGDTILSGAGNDVIYAGTGSDSIFSGMGNDTVFGNYGNDTINGGMGSNTLDYSYFVPQGSYGDIEDGLWRYALEIDMITQSVRINSIRTSGSESSHVSSEYVQEFSNFNNFIGSSGNDNFVLRPSDDIFGIDGGGGEDYLVLIDSESGSFNIQDSDFANISNIYGIHFNLNGPVTIEGGTTFFESSGIEFVDGFFVGDSLFDFSDVVKDLEIHAEDESGEPGSAIIYGGSGNDYIKVVSGNNQIFGGDGNDTIYGGLGNDTMTGGDGDDEFRVTGGSDIIEDLGDGADELIVASGAEVTAEVVGDWSPTDTTINNGSVTLNLAGLNGTTAPEVVDLSSVGGSNGWLISGNDENNILTGSSNNDTISGGLGNDTIIGGEGADELWGGSSFSPEAGNNTFVYTSVDDSPTDGYDTIMDFVSGGDGDILLFKEMLEDDKVFSFVGNFVYQVAGNFNPGDNANPSAFFQQEGATGPYYLYVDVTGDESADMRILMNNVTELEEVNFEWT